MNLQQPQLETHWRLRSHEQTLTPSAFREWAKRVCLQIENSVNLASALWQIGGADEASFLFWPSLSCGHSEDLSHLHEANKIQNFQ